MTTVQEIIVILRHNGASQIKIKFEKRGPPTEIEFFIKKSKYKITCDYTTILRTTIDFKELAVLNTWKLLKDLLEAKERLLQAGVITKQQAFLIWNIF
jgi:hypothetical protein